jgi:hypothetical protein
VDRGLKFAYWKQRVSGETGRRQRPGTKLYYTKQNKINKHYYKAPENFSCSEGLDRGFDSPDPSTRIGKGSQNTPHCCGYKGHPKDADSLYHYFNYSV